MKVYERNYSDFRYPHDMAKIVLYLNERGKILVNHKTLERLYEEFSRTHCAGWLIVDEDYLEEFEIWLTEYDI